MYVQWIYYVHLTNPLCYINISFNFDSHSDVIKSNQHIALNR